MTKHIKILAFVLATAIGTIAGSLAHACDTTIGTACDIERIQSGMPEVSGKKAATPRDMVCLSVLATQPGALVLAEGRVEPGEPVAGRVITSWRPQLSQWKQTKHGFLREICIPARLLSSVATLCDDHNRSIWTASDTTLLKRQKRIPASDPACLLGKEGCAVLGL